MNNTDLLDWAISQGATSTQLNTALIEAYQALGATSSQLNKAAMEYYATIGLDGSLPDSEKQFWTAGKDFTIVVGEAAPFVGWAAGHGTAPADTELYGSDLVYIQSLNNIMLVGYLGGSNINGVDKLAVYVEGWGEVTCIGGSGVYQSAADLGLTDHILTKLGEEMTFNIKVTP
jgi:hypothetical protein